MSSPIDGNKFLVLDFDDGPQVVPRIWISDSGKSVFWPNITNMTAYYKAVESEIEPTSKWTEIDFISEISSASKWICYLLIITLRVHLSFLNTKHSQGVCDPVHFSKLRLKL